jgi:phytoene synthase
MTSDLKQAYEHCRHITRSRAKNFYYAIRTLPARKRQAVYAAYAFCRICDDISDEERSLEDKLRLFGQTRQLLQDGYDGKATDPVFAALGDASATFDIPARYFEEVIAGVEMDLIQKRFQDFEELRDYCYKVASAVGLICIEVFGYKDPRAREYATDLGLAMQLTNVMRDIKEDAQRGRIYIPQDEMASFGYSPGELEAGVVNDAFRNLMRFQVARARRYFASGRRLIPLLSLRSRACPALLLAVYSRILDRIEANQYDVFQRRIGLSTREKLFLTARLWALSLIPAAYPRRS